ncbi:MAG: hypothetical protein ACE5GC_01880, partial [Acidimicrobiia bacterium]
LGERTAAIGGHSLTPIQLPNATNLPGTSTGNHPLVGLELHPQLIGRHIVEHSGLHVTTVDTR